MKKQITNRHLHLRYHPYQCHLGPHHRHHSCNWDHSKDTPNIIQLSIREINLSCNALFNHIKKKSNFKNKNKEREG